MEKEEYKKSLIERFNNLQPEIQAAITNSDYEKNLYQIAQKYKLSVEQMGDLELNTTLVMLGEIHPDDYNNELLTDLKLPQENINELVNDINESVLKPIRDILKSNFEEDNKIEKEFSNTPVPPYKKDAPENKPVAESQPNILEDKLTKPVVSENSTSIHKPEIKKETTDNFHDPYREII